MPSFGSRSRSRLEGVDPRMVNVLKEAIEVFDFTIVCGRRGKQEQDEAYATGASKKRYPQSKHNANPSRAVDIAPWQPGIDWNDALAFSRLFGIIEAVAHRQGIKVRWGGDWDGDQSSRDQSFMDIGHLELVD